MSAPHDLAIGAAAVGIHGKEGDLFRRVVIWSPVSICLLPGLQATLLSWMVP